MFVSDFANLAKLDDMDTGFLQNTSLKHEAFREHSESRSLESDVFEPDKIEDDESVSKIT